MDMRVKRLDSSSRKEAQRLFIMMAEVFKEDCDTLTDSYLDQLLCRKDFWVLAVFAGDDIIGGVTAHTLPMTYNESSEIFIFDIAVRSAHQRQGVGRHPVTTLRRLASEVGVYEIFVAADNEDEHALDFYRRLGGMPTPTTMFDFPRT